jgi:hypothetical protein
MESAMLRAPGLAVLSLLFLGIAPSANAGIINFTAGLSGPNESPPNASPGTGFANIHFNTVLNTLNVQVSFSGLVAPNTAAHIHCCTTVPGLGTAGVATSIPTFTGFPGGVTGIYDHTFDMSLASSYNPAFVTANGGSVALAELALIKGMIGGNTYLNIHSATFPKGEIRGFLLVPEPAPIGLFGLGLVAFGFLWRKRTI